MIKETKNNIKDVEKKNVDWNRKRFKMKWLATNDCKNRNEKLKLREGSWKYDDHDDDENDGDGGGGGGGDDDDDENDDKISSRLKSIEKKNYNQFVGENDVAGSSLTCTTVESGRASLTSRSTDRFAPKINNNNNNSSNNNNKNNNNNNNFNYKYYGFLDSGDETKNDLITNKKKKKKKNDANGVVAVDGNEENDVVVDFFHNKNNRSRNDSDSINKYKMNDGVKTLMTTTSEKEIVYENIKTDSRTKMLTNKKTSSDSCKTFNKNRNEINKKQNHEHLLSRRFLECNLKFGGKFGNFAQPETSTWNFNSVYGGDNVYDNYNDGFSYLESKYAYTVSGIPGNLAQSSAAAAFFAR